MENVMPEELQQEVKNKDKKRYDEIVTTITNLVGGKQNLAPKKKLPLDETAEVIAELFGEEHAELRSKVKDSLKTLLKERLKDQSEIEAKKKELADLEAKKMKEFIEAGGKFLRQVDAIAINSLAYTEMLKVALGGEPTPAVPAEIIVTEVTNAPNVDNTLGQQ